MEEGGLVARLGRVLRLGAGQPLQDLHLGAALLHQLLRESDKARDASGLKVPGLWIREKISLDPIAFKV